MEKLPCDLIDGERFRLLLDRVQKRADQLRAEPLNGYPENAAESVVTKTVADNEVCLSVVKHDIPGCAIYYCGYVRFPKKMLESDVFMQFVPVHGGITFDRADTDGSYVYGFDCNHLSDATAPMFTDAASVIAECERLAQAICAAAVWEKEFLACPKGSEWRDRRIAIIKRYHSELRKLSIPFSLKDNLGAMIEVLSGDIGG